MSDFDQRFQRIAEAYRLSPGGPIADKQQRRRLYGLYRQAIDGDVGEKQPGFFNFEDQGKYKAWKKLKGTPEDEVRRRFVELAEQLGYRDPGDSPVAWISDESWRREESWTNPDYDESFSCINDPDVIGVDDQHRRMAPKVGTGEHASIPQKGSDDEHLASLQDAPETLAFHLYSPKWPICCRRLSVLVGYRDVDEDVAHVVPRAHVLEEADDSLEIDASTEISAAEPEPYGEETLRADLLMFHCHDCGRVYLSGHDR